MKNHIVFKFIAVFLCAASLLGAVASGVGMFAMTETGLYDRHVEDVYVEYLESDAYALASEAAVRYAAMNLGGCTTELADSYYGTYWYYNIFDWDRVGYEIQDAEGNVLQSSELEDGEEVEYEFTFPVSGQYLKVLNEMSAEEYEQANPTAATEVVADGDYVVYSALYEGCTAEVGLILVDYSDGSGEVIGDYEFLGWLFCEEDGSVAFRSEMDFGGLDLQYPREAVHIVFLMPDGSLLYEASHPNSVFTSYSYRDGVTCIGLRPIDDTETGLGEDVGIYDAIPPEGIGVSQISVTYADDYSESAGGVPDIGFLSYEEDGTVVFRSDYEVMDLREEMVTHILFRDEDGNLVYEASDPEGVGYFCLEDEELVFRADMPEVTGIPSGTGTYVYDDVPPKGAAVYYVELLLEGGGELYTVEERAESTATAIGNASHDANGNVTFACNDWKDFVFSKPAKVVYIHLEDYDGRVLFEAYTQDTELGSGEVIGTFAYNDSDRLVFTMVGAEAAGVAQDTADTDAQDPNAGIALIREADETETAAAKETTEEAAAETAAEEETVPEATVAEETAVPETTEPEEVVPEMTVAPTVPETELTDVTEAVAETEISSADMTAMATEPLPAMDVSGEFYSYYSSAKGGRQIVEYTYEAMPEYTVEVRLASGALEDEFAWTLLRIVYHYREDLVKILGFSLLILAVTVVYLCCAAGRKPGSPEIHAGGLNCLPLDLYCGIDILAVVGLIALAYAGGRHLLQSNVQVGCLFMALMAYVASLLVVGFGFACAAQFKTPGGYWWRNSLCGWCLRMLVRFWKWFVKACLWMREKLPPVLGKIFGKLWIITKVVSLKLWGAALWLLLFAKRLLVMAWNWVKQGSNWAGRKLVRFYGMLPLTWQWLLTGFGMFLLMAIVFATNGEEVLIVLCIGACIGIILYGTHCFGVLLESAKRMSKGDLDEKVDDKLLVGSFKDFAGELNSLADVAVIAAQKQLKSERMKTELITNVSHDIKTPLTSIINYVDLLQKPHTDAEQEQYLEVLDRQSQRLKKLIDDLMEMSKASTGNLAVDIGRVDAAEAINQALGEFADKLDRAQLTPVFRQPDDPIEMMADGRLVWRVMSNLLGNAVKYALPGTRLYVDLMAVDGKVIISMKNISREELNVNADELLERFVRGDVSRNTEGSGLGLNIAQSLMELQKGQLQLLVDGDLFKVTLIFPGT